MAITPERNFPPTDPLSGSVEAASALLELHGGPLREVDTATSPKSILRSDHEPRDDSPRRRLRSQPKRRVTFDNSPSKPAAMPPKRKNTGSSSSAATAGKKTRIVIKAKAPPVPVKRKPPAKRKPPPPKRKTPSRLPSPSPPLESSSAERYEEETAPSPPEDEDPFDDPFANENDDIQEIPREAAVSSFPHDDQVNIIMPTKVKVVFQYPPNHASQFRGIAVPVLLTKYPEGPRSFFGGLLVNHLLQWLEDSKKRVAANLDGYTVKQEFLNTTVQLRRGATLRIVHSDQWADDSDLDTIQDSVLNIMKQVNGTVAHNLEVVYTFRLSVAPRVVPGRWHGLTTPSSASRGSVGTRSREIQDAAAAEAEEDNPFRSRLTTANVGDVSRLSERLGFSARSTRTSNMQEVVAAQKNTRVELFAQLSQQLECRDRGRCANCKKESKLASWCFIKEDRSHLALTHDDLLKWADLIEKKQEKASLNNIPQSVYDRAMVRLIGQKRGGPEEVSNVLSALGPNDDILSAILGRPGKAGVSKPGGSGVGGGNIINVNGGGGESSQIALALVNALAGRVTAQQVPQQVPQQPSLPPLPPWAGGHAYTLPTDPSVGAPPLRTTPPPPRRPLVFSSSPVVPESLESDGLLLEEFLLYVRRRKARHSHEKIELGRLALAVREAGLSMLRDFSAQPDGWFVERGFDDDLGSFLRQCVKEFVRERALAEERKSSPAAPTELSNAPSDNVAAGSD